MSSLEIPEDLDLSSLTDKQKILILDKLFFKILSAETDFEFEENLKIYLPKLLLKLTTNEEIVRRKIMEILVHINKRIKSRPSVQLPLEDLLEKFNDPNFSNLSFFANFSLIYIKMGYPRLSSKEKADMVEKLFQCLEGKSLAHQDSIFYLIIDGIRFLDLKPNDNKNKEKYGFLNNLKLRKQFLDYLFYFLLLPYSLNSNKHVPTQPSTTTEQAQTSQTQQSQVQNETPACLSEAIFKRMKNDVNFENGDEIEQYKIGILKFLSFNIFEPEQILFHFIISTSDTRYSVVQIAEIHIKRIVGSVDLNDPNIVNQFYQIYLGDIALVQKQKQNDVNKIEPANTRIRLKLFPYLLRSRQASSTVPQAIQLVFDSLFGSSLSTNQKIKTYAVQFVHLMALNCEAQKLAKIGTVLVQGMNKLIAESKDDPKLRGLAYVAVGKLSRKIPNTISNDISIVHNFFSALEKEDSDTKLHIQEALVLMIDAFRDSKPEEKNLLLTLLFQYIENEVSNCRSMAVKFSFEIFEHDNLESRFLLLLATSDSKEEIRQEAVKYLHRTQDNEGNEIKMASFETWVEFISKKMEDRLARSYKTFTFGTHTLAFDLNCYQEILVILRLALSISAGLKPQIIDAKSLESFKDEAPGLLKYVRQLTNSNLNCLFKYVNIIKEYALTVANPLGLYLLLEISSISSFNITKFLHNDIEWFKNQSFSINEQVRHYSAELWSLVLINYILESQTSINLDINKINFDPFFNNLINMNKTILKNASKSFESKHGCLFCLGYAIGKFYNLNRSGSIKAEYKMNIKEIISSLIGYLDDPNLSMATIISIGEIARNGSLIFDNKQTLLDLVEILNKKILTSKETNKLKEKAASTLGYMCLNPVIILEPTNDKQYQIGSIKFDSFNRFIIQKLLDSSQAKQIELHMAIGEAIVNSALGKLSNASLNLWTNESNQIENSSDETTDQDLEWLLNELFKNYLPNPNQHLRQASCLWLLIIVKKSSKISNMVKKNLLRVQDAFIQRLSESDEITQEVASKGIGIIFSLADEENKNYLVSRLVDSLTGGTKNKKSSTVASSAESGLKINDENQEIFQPEQIGKTPEGGNITTYKELCSLASDLNKPDLIYQFMNLAHHNSIWNTRRGVAFGFGQIAQLSSEQLQPYLASIVPKLFRYQFDPTPRIQQSMSSIWDSIIKQDNKKVVDLYLNEILTDLEQNMHNPLWRVRESCSNALCDLLKGGRNLEQISGKFGKFWSLLFRLADDIKESVRASAELTLKSLQRVTISYSTSVSNQTVCQQTINSVLPVLLLEGLNSNLNEVRNLSVLTIRDLSKQTSSIFIKPYLVDMIINLLEALSGFEPPDLNYISLKLNSQDAQEKLDMARISASKNTPMIEIINMNMENLKDDQLLTDLIPRLIEIIKKGLGVSTKAGVCSLITSLIDQQPQKMAVFSGKLMAALVNCMSNEHNKTINKFYCNTIGSIAKVAKESSIENLINKLQEWYLEKDDDGLKLSCGQTLLAIAQNNSEILMKYSKKCIPFSFFAMHQSTEQKQKTNDSIWNEVFEEITSGTEYAIRANLMEIITFIKIGLEHQSWKLRIQSALSINTICVKLQSNIDQECLNEILKLLIAALSTRTWSGKEKVLTSVSSLFINCKLKLSFENKLVEEIINSVFKEASKQSSNIDSTYKMCSFRCLTDMVQFSSAHFKDQYFETFWNNFVLKYFQEEFEDLLKKEKMRINQQIELIKKRAGEVLEEKMEEEITKEKSEEQKEDEKETDKEAEALNSSLKMILLENLGKCWSNNSEVQEKYNYQATLLISDKIYKSTWSNQVLLIKSLDSLFSKWSIEFETKNVDDLIRSIEVSSQSVINCIAKTNYSNLRREGILYLEKIVEFLNKEKEDAENWNKLIEEQDGLKIRSFVVNQIILDGLRVLFEDATTKETSLDLKEKSKKILKILNSKF